ncbi:MAG: N-acetylmuramoyl-L-alanine amidase, partial [Verrucomicrobiales bacterium]
GTVTFILEPGLTGIGRVEATTGAAPWVTVQNGRLWVEPPVQEGMKNVVRLLPVEVVELSPKVKDEDSNDIAGSEKPNSGKPLTPLVEVDPNANRIAHREIKVRIGDAMIDKKVTWTLEALPGGTPETIRGQWEDSPNHKDRFEASMVYGANGFRKVSQSSGVTTVGTDGHTAIRVNMPPIGFNQARIKVQIEGMSTPIVLIDMEVPGVVIIDPGHGGQDSGAVGRTDRTILEKDLALEYSFSLRQKVIDKFGAGKHNLKLYMTRKTNGEYMENGARANLVRDKGADVFLSIHFNSAESTTSRGTEYVTRSIGQVNAAEDDQLGVSVQSSTLAAIIASDPEGIHRDPKSGQFAVISDSNYGNTADYHPIRGVTIEVEFLSHETALGSVKLSNAKGKAIKTKFAADVSTDIYNNILNQP